VPEPVIATLALVGLGLVTGGVAGLMAGRALRRRPKDLGPTAAEMGERLRYQARVSRAATLSEAEIGAREEGLAVRAEAEAQLRAEEESLARLRTELAAREAELGAGGRALEEGRVRLEERQPPLKALEQEGGQQRRAAAEALAGARAMLEKVSGERAEGMRRALVEAEIEEARAASAQLVRLAGEGSADSETGRRAKRVMGIAVGRFSGHYLTERHQSLVPLPAAREGRPAMGQDELNAIAGVAGVKLTLQEAGDAVRIEGLDGVGREVARRSLARAIKRPSAQGATEAVLARIAREAAAELDREVTELGQRAFSVLEIAGAHPDIVKLVGRLNWRTSYTQNQWKHAVEAAFLCSMMAEELGLDRALARRAALMHDIGKALTHELDGSHAVIGADYARRLGEAEVVANAIGAHHTDEPFSSAYAYLVAAADAMSGARPGARRQAEDNHMAKIADLERISRGFGGVAEAFAVQGGREVRVVVDEQKVDDLGAVALSASIAQAISREMTFPGQIRVTVIREFRALERAGG
jgi:ribonucrease Y